MSSCGRTSCFKGVNSDQAHTHSNFSYSMSVTHPTARTQDISTCCPSLAGVNGSTRGSHLFLLHRSILLKQDACSPLVHICHHKCLLHVYVEMTQDVTVKKGMWRCLVVHQLTLQCGMTSTARHGENITCRGMTSTTRHAHAFTHSSISCQHREQM